MPKKIQWPEWMLQPHSARMDKSVSPAASFRPASAASGKEAAFQAMTTPASALAKRALILDQATFKNSYSKYTQAEWLAFLSLLTDNGVELYFCCENSTAEPSFIKANKDTPCPLNWADKLGEFDSNKDFDSLVRQQSVAFDQVVYLDQQKMNEIQGETLFHFSWNPVFNKPNEYIDDERKLLQQLQVADIERSAQLFLDYPSLGSSTYSINSPDAFLQALSYIEIFDSDFEQSVIQQHLPGLSFAHPETLPILSKVTRENIFNIVSKRFPTLFNLFVNTESIDYYNRDPQFISTCARVCPEKILGYLHQNPVRSIEKLKGQVRHFPQFLESIFRACDQSLLCKKTFTLLLADNPKELKEDPFFLSQIDTITKDYTEPASSEDDLLIKLILHPSKLTIIREKNREIFDTLHSKTRTGHGLHTFKQFTAGETDEALKLFKYLFNKQSLKEQQSERVTLAINEQEILEKLQAPDGTLRAWAIEEIKHKTLSEELHQKLTEKSVLQQLCKQTKSIQSWLPHLKIEQNFEQVTHHILENCSPEEIEWFVCHYQENLVALLNRPTRNTQQKILDRATVTPRVLFKSLPKSVQNRYLSIAVTEFSQIDEPKYNTESRYLSVPAEDRFLQHFMTFEYLNEEEPAKITGMSVELPHLVALELTTAIGRSSVELPRHLLFLIKHCPKLRLVLLPPTLLAQLAEEEGFAEVEHLQFQTIEPKPLLANIAQRANAIHVQESPITVVDDSITNLTTNQLFVGRPGYTGINLSPEASEPVYNLRESGQVLSGSSQSSIRVRTGIISIDLQTLTKTMPVAASYENIAEPEALSEVNLQSFKTGAAGQIFAKFKLQLDAGVRTRLLSLSAQEQIMAAITTPQSAIHFEKGDDDFYYATAQAKTNLEYVIRSSSVSLDSTQTGELPEPIRQIIEHYKNSSKFKQIATNGKLPEKGSLTNKEWLDLWYEQCAGVCEHRCLSVYHRIVSRHPQLQDQVRLLDIDNTHVRLEVKTSQGAWQQVDLGAGKATNNYEAGTAPYQASPPNAKLHRPTTSNDVASKTAPEIRLRPSIPTQSEITHKAIITSLASALKPSFNLQAVAPINSEQELVRTLSAPNSERPPQNLLIESFQINEHMAIALQDAKDKGFPFLTLNTYKQAQVREDSVSLNEPEHPVLSNETELAQFLQQARQTPSPCRLLVDWSTLNPRQRLTLNTLLDRDRTISGTRIPDNVQVVGFIDKLPKDSSFLTRHDCLRTAQFSVDSTQEILEDSSRSITIDLKGMPNWQEVLFGEIQCDRNAMQWQKSAFLKALSSHSAPNIKIINATIEARAELNDCLIKAKASGYFTYHQHKLPVSKHAIVAIENTPFRFNDFQSDGHRVILNIHDNSFSDIPIINTHLFDHLLVNQSVTDAQQYLRHPGWLEAARGGQLALHITSALTESQWYCLLATAKQYQVKLSLLLSPKVQLPNNCYLPIQDSSAFSNDVKAAESCSASEKGAVIHVCNDTNRALKEVVEKCDKSPLIIDVEDYGFQDIVGRINFEQTDRQFSQFSYQISPVIEALSRGRHVVLKGEFSDAVLNALHPLISNRHAYRLNDKVLSLPGKLTLIADEKNNPDFSWHNPELFQPKHYSVKSSSHTPTVLLDESQCQDTPHRHWPSEPRFAAGETLNAAKAFLRQRMDVIRNYLLAPENGQTEANPPLLQLIGESGVGKSYLISNLAKQHQEDIQIYHEFADLDAWASDHSEKSKILFVDENNIEDKHLTLFANLTRPREDGKRELLYQGKLYELDASHKVIFARNPHSYGGGRAKQKLFDLVSVPEIYCHDFPDSYIYENLLKPIFLSSGLAERKVDRISENAFKQDCAVLLQRYHAKKDMTVRELQTWTLKYCTHLQNRGPLYLANTNTQLGFIQTESNAQARVMLSTALCLNEKVTQNKLSAEGTGLNAILIEGAPGLGKSELLKQVLQQRGYKRLSLGDQANHKSFCKIDANMPFEEKKHLIIDAFDKGYIVWVDEINSCIDDGLEKVLNAVLTGLHPDTKNKAKKPGFQLIATANSAGLEGRSVLSQAFRHRAVQITLPKPDKEFLCKFLQQEMAEEDKRLVNVELFSETLLELMMSDDNINLRSIRDKLPTLLATFEQQEQRLSAEQCRNLRESVNPALKKAGLFFTYQIDEKTDPNAYIIGLIREKMSVIATNKTLPKYSRLLALLQSYNLAPSATVSIYEQVQGLARKLNLTLPADIQLCESDALRAKLNAHLHDAGQVFTYQIAKDADPKDYLINLIRTKIHMITDNITLPDSSRLHVILKNHQSPSRTSTDSLAHQVKALCSSLDITLPHDLRSAINNVVIPVARQSIAN